MELLSLFLLYVWLYLSKSPLVVLPHHPCLQTSLGPRFLECISLLSIPHPSMAARLMLTLQIIILSQIYSSCSLNISTWKSNRHFKLKGSLWFSWYSCTDTFFSPHLPFINKWGLHSYYFEDNHLGIFLASPSLKHPISDMSANASILDSWLHHIMPPG